MHIEHILLVDDDPAIRCIAEISLAEVGKWRVSLADSGKMALRFLETEKPDLIILDVMMPGMDGPATFECIKSSVNNRQTPVIFMTAKVQKQEAEHYRRLGAAGVIPKPFDPMTLPSEIREILNGVVSLAR